MARLLVVDDEKSLCQMLEIGFRKDGHSVETVFSGQAAEEKDRVPSLRPRHFRHSHAGPLGH